MSKSSAILLLHGYRYALSLVHHAAEAENCYRMYGGVMQAGGPYKKGYLFCTIRSRYYNLYKRELLIPMESLESIAEPMHVDYAHGFDSPLLSMLTRTRKKIQRYFSINDVQVASHE